MARRPDTKSGEANGQVRGQRDPAGRPLPPPATTHSWPERVELLCRRHARGQALFHPADRILFDRWAAAPLHAATEP
jgi:hypothetical protein